MKEFDVIIIGAGPGGYYAAELAAEKGKSVLLIEKAQLGGTCLNWGCIPTKTLLNIAKQFSYRKELQKMGVEDLPSYKHSIALKWKNTVVNTLQTGIKGLLKKQNVSIMQGEAKVVSLEAGKKTVCLVGNEQEQFISQYVIIASGVESSIPPILGIESTNFLTSREILELEILPEKLAVLGGGVIGIEFATIFAQLGTKVQVFEALPEILPMMDKESTLQLKRILEKEYSIEFFCNTTVEKFEANTLFYKAMNTEEETVVGQEFDVLLVSTGRNTNLQKFSDMGLDISSTGIVVDEYMQTNIPKVYAIGDVVGTFQLAHTAYRMAEVAVNSIDSRANKRVRMRYVAVPMVVYTNPELASCGLSEEQARKYADEKGSSIVSASLPITMSGRVIAEHGTKPQGYCKIIADKETTKILGIHLVAPMASEIISVASVILETELGVEDLSEIIFPHPSVGEILHNVSMLLLKKLHEK